MAIWLHLSFKFLQDLIHSIEPFLVSRAFFRRGFEGKGHWVCLNGPGKARFSWDNNAQADMGHGRLLLGSMEEKTDGSVVRNLNQRADLPVEDSAAGLD